jgi:hypothetical protein
VRIGKRFSTSTTRSKSTLEYPSTSDVISNALVATPTRQQLVRAFFNAAIPMVGFGFMDQTVMLQAGNAIDCSIGVTFGLSTLTAAAFGQVCSDASGVLFGGTLESLAARAGLPKAGLSSAQRKLKIVKHTKFVGGFCGVIVGCILGLVNLFFIDTERSSTLKLQQFNEEQEFEFRIEASNAIRKDATTFTVRGPDVDGMLASMTAALAVRGCSLVELHAKRRLDQGVRDDGEEQDVEDVFYVVNRETGEPYPDEELEELARALLDSTRTPMNVKTVKAKIHELENTNSSLLARVTKLEKVVEDKQITIVPTPTSEGKEEFVTQ